MSFVGELENPFTSQQTSQIREVLTRYLSRRITYHGCLILLLAVLGTAQPIEKLEGILRTPDMPIPAFATRHGRDSRAKSRPWSSYEDQRLLAGIHRYGFDDWQVVAMFVGNGRTKAQCSQRWFRGLDPKICKEQWTPEQDSRLIALVAALGEKNWTRIALEIGNRCDVQCRYRYKQLQKDAGFDEKQSAAIAENGRIRVAAAHARRRTKATDLATLQQALGQVQAMQAHAQMQNAFMQFQPIAQHTDGAKRGSAGQMMAQGAPLDSPGSFGMSASGSIFGGITPANSFKFES
jgi:hypothetical protein